MMMIVTNLKLYRPFSLPSFGEFITLQIDKEKIKEWCDISLEPKKPKLNY